MPWTIVAALTDPTNDSGSSSLINTLTCWHDFPPSCKLIVTSRDEGVPDIFHDVKSCCQIVLETEHHDICFFKNSFATIHKELGKPVTWPKETNINLLTERAAGVFIWADSVIGFIKGGNQSADDIYTVASESLDTDTNE